MKITIGDEDVFEHGVSVEERLRLAEGMLRTIGAKLRISSSFHGYYLSDYDCSVDPVVRQFIQRYFEGRG